MKRAPCSPLVCNVLTVPILPTGETLHIDGNAACSDMTHEPESPEAIAWTVSRLLALSGEQGAADRLVAAVLAAPSGKWVPPWTLAGHPPRMSHELDPVPIVRRRRSFFSPEKRNLKKLASSAKC